MHFLKYLKNFIPQIILIVLILIVQAYCNLALPSYTSDILDIGVEQGGIENAAAVELSDDTMSDLMLFMDSKDQKYIQDSYHEKNGIWYLNDSADTDKVSDDLELPMVMVSNLSAVSEDDMKEMLSEQTGMSEDQLKNLSIEQIESMTGMQFDTSTDSKGNTTINMLPLLQSMKASGQLSESSIKSMTDEVTKRFGDSADMFMSSAAVEFVKSEYKTLGVDTDHIQRSYMRNIGGRMIAVTIGMAVASIFAGLIASFVAAKNSQKLRDGLFKRVLSFGNTEIDRFSTASLITRSTNDVQQIQMTMFMLLRMVLFAPILAIGGIIKVSGMHTGLSWIIVVAAIVMVGLIAGLVTVAMPKFRVMQSKIDRVNLVSREILDGIPVIRAFGRERHEETRFDEANRDFTRTQLFTYRVMAIMLPSMMFVMNGVNLLIVWFAAKGMDEGMVQIGDMVAFMTYALQIIMAFMMIEMMAVMLPRAAVAAKRVDEVIDTEPVIRDSADAASHEQTTYKGRVEFDHVTFRYPGAEHPALDDINFTAEPGQTTAIIGSTGCGKTTLVNLVPRLYDVTDGAVRLDDVDIREIGQKKLRDQIGFVPQKGFLFSGTIETNIKYSGPQVTDEEMKEAATIAQATEFIDEKEELYESPISQGGTNVSGGQKQRLSIARALAKKAPVLIFDDSFSALDYKTDVALRKALNERQGHATVLIVAQRISTVLHADKIIVMDEGKITGIGTHDELMKDCQTYQEIARSQLSEQELAQKGGAR